MLPACDGADLNSEAIQEHLAFHGAFLPARFNMAPVLAVLPCAPTPSPSPAQPSPGNIVQPSACSFKWAADMSLFCGT